MNDLKEVTPISQLTGMSVLSLASGNKLGEILDLFIDPVNGIPVGVTLSTHDGRFAGLLFSGIHSFGRDAVMASADESVTPLESDALGEGQPASKLIGTKIITESGDMLGQISNVFVTLKPPPQILYEATQSVLDRLLGREFFLPASVGHALSDDCTRLVVADITTEIADSDLASFVAQRIEVRTLNPNASAEDRDDTIPVRVADDENDETLVRFRDEDDTVLRPPRE